MRWQNHIVIGASFGAVIDPTIIPVAVLGSTAPDWLEYVFRLLGYRVRHRTVTHVFTTWLMGCLFFYYFFDWHHVGLGFCVGGFSHVFADSFTVAGVPFTPWSDARFHLFGGKLRTGNMGEYVVAGMTALLCTSWLYYSPVHQNGTQQNTSGFIPFFYDYKKKYDEGLVDGSEWKENRFKLI